MDKNEEQYELQLKKVIEFMYEYETPNFLEIARELGSFDINVVKKIFDEIEEKEKDNKNPKDRSSYFSDRLYVRGKTAQFLYDLPAPNSIRSQWWFSLDTIEKIAFYIRRISDNEPIAFFGAPSVAFFIIIYLAMQRFMMLIRI